MSLHLDYENIFEKIKLLNHTLKYEYQEKIIRTKMTRLKAAKIPRDSPKTCTFFTGARVNYDSGPRFLS